MKNKQAIYLLFAANTISGVSQGITMLAIPWYFTSIIDRPGLFGVIYMAINIASLFWGLYAGTIVDRYDRQKVFLGITGTGAVIMFSLSALGYSLGGVPIWAAGLAFAMTIFIYNIHYPNLYAFAQEITDSSSYSKITSWLEVQGQMTSAIAGGIGALLLEGIHLNELNIAGSTLQVNLHIEAWPLQKVLLVDGGTYILAMIFLLLMRYERIAERNIDKSSIARRIHDGLNWLKAHPMVFLFGTASYAVFVTVLITGFFLQPRYIEEHLNASVSTYAISDVFFSLGSVLAGIGIVWIFRNTSLIKSVIILSLVAAAYFIISIFNYNYFLMFITFMLLGTANAGTRIIRMTWIFKHVPNSVIGRTGSVFNSLNVLCRIVLIGVFSTAFFANEQIVYAFAIQAIFILAATTVMIVYYRRLSEIG